MSKVVNEQSVMDMVICRGAKPNEAKQRVPEMRVFTVNQTKPRRISRSKSHVFPNIAVDNVRCDEQRDKDHADSIHRGAVESIEEFWVEEAMVRLVAELIDFWADFVFRDVHERLKKINGNKLG